jgi:hypothetical protein
MTRVGFTAEDLADNTVQQEQKTTLANKKQSNEDLADNTVQQEQKTTSANKKQSKQSKQSKKPAEVTDAADSYT